MGTLKRAALQLDVAPAWDVKRRPLAKRESGVEITPEYRRVLELIAARRPLIFVSGKAGTGKSTLIRFLRSTLQGNIVVVAPTGVAALNCGGQTIHSFFRFPCRFFHADEVFRRRNSSLYASIDLLIIDEVSMVRADLLDAVDRFLRLNGPRRGRPFGGIPVLLVGDLFQLPPVVASNEERNYIDDHYQCAHFFAVPGLAEFELAYVELKRVFRQTDDNFAGLLNNLREGIRLDDTLRTLNARCVRPAPAGCAVVLSATNEQADRINASHLAAIAGRPTLYHAVSTGVLAVTSSRLPAPATLALKVGAQVMFLRNDPARRWVNGDTGTVASFDQESVRVCPNGANGDVSFDVPAEDWISYRYRYDFRSRRIETEEVGRFRQLPLNLAWAMTIHKSQGRTIPFVHVDLGQAPAFAPGQTYVAASRCPRLDRLSFARPLHADDVRCDPAVVRFYALLKTIDTAQATPTTAAEPTAPASPHSREALPRSA